RALLWKGYITQPAVIPDNSVQTLHCSPCICIFRGIARNADFIFSWYSLRHERKYPRSLPVPAEKAGSSVSSACSCVVRLATKFCFACSFASVAGALLFMGASQFLRYCCAPAVAVLVGSALAADATCTSLATVEAGALSCDGNTFAISASRSRRMMTVSPTFTRV